MYFVFFRPEFEKLTGSEMMETCYLVNELFIGPEEQSWHKAAFLWAQHVCLEFYGTRML